MERDYAFLWSQKGFIGHTSEALDVKKQKYILT
jgi:hypothetical protein